MRDKRDHTQEGAPLADYASAVARAVEWLGDRYLLAKPINIHMQPPRSSSAMMLGRPGESRISEDRSAR
jgi:hypothetical protein